MWPGCWRRTRPYWLSACLLCSSRERSLGSLWPVWPAWCAGTAGHQRWPASWKVSPSNAGPLLHTTIEFALQALQSSGAQLQLPVLGLPVWVDSCEPGLVHHWNPIANDHVWRTTSRSERLGKAQTFHSARSHRGLMHPVGTGGPSAPCRPATQPMTSERSPPLLPQPPSPSAWPECPVRLATVNTSQGSTPLEDASLWPERRPSAMPRLAAAHVLVDLDLVGHGEPGPSCSSSSWTPWASAMLLACLWSPSFRLPQQLEGWGLLRRTWSVLATTHRPHGVLHVPLRCHRMQTHMQSLSHHVVPIEISIAQLGWQPPFPLPSLRKVEPHQQPAPHRLQGGTPWRPLTPPQPRFGAYVLGLKLQTKPQYHQVTNTHH